MATTNQEIENPSNALERQVQTLIAVVEWLTQQNHELEWQLEQQNYQEPNDQNDEQERDERDNDRPPWSLREGRLRGKQCRQ